METGIGQQICGLVLEQQCGSAENSRRSGRAPDRVRAEEVEALQARITQEANVVYQKELARIGVYDGSYPRAAAVKHRLAVAPTIEACE